jgi:hypothetical protein
MLLIFPQVIHNAVDNLWKNVDKPPDLPSTSDPSQTLAYPRTCFLFPEKEDYQKIYS